MSSRHTIFFAKLISLSWGILEKGFKGLFVLVTWTSSVFRAFSSETERHPPGGLASSSEKLLSSFSSSTKETAYQSSQMIPLSFPYHWKYLDKIWRLSKILRIVTPLLWHCSNTHPEKTLFPGFLMSFLHVYMVSGNAVWGMDKFLHVNSSVLYPLHSQFWLKVNRAISSGSDLFSFGSINMQCYTAVEVDGCCVSNPL